MCLDMTITATLKRDSIKRGGEEPGHAANEEGEPGGRCSASCGEDVQGGESWRLDRVDIHEIKKLATDKAIRHGNDMKKTISTDFKVLNCLQTACI